MGLFQRLAYECLILTQQRTSLDPSFEPARATTALPMDLFFFSEYQGEKQHAVSPMHHPEPHAQVLDVELLHFCKRHASKYVGRSAASCLCSSGCDTLASAGRANIGRLSGPRRQMIGTIRRLQTDDRFTKGHRADQFGDCHLVVAR